MPRSSRKWSALMASNATAGGAGLPAPPAGASLHGRCVLDLDLTADDLRDQRLDLVDHVGGHLRVDLPETDALLLEAEHLDAALVRAVHDRLDRVVHADVHLLDGAGHDVVA